MKYILLIALTATLFITACTSTTTQTEVETPSLSAPEFQVETIDGEIISSESEKPTLIYFMASWCPSCAKNWKVLSEVAPEYADKIDFFAISIDPTDTNEVLSELATEKGFEFSTVAGNPQFANNFDVKTQTAVRGISSDGSFVIETSGVFTEAEWREMFESLE